MGSFAAWFIDDMLADHAVVGASVADYRTLLAWQAFVTTMPAAPGDKACYLMFFNSAVAPSAGQSPLWCAPAFTAAGAWYAWTDQEAAALQFNAGLAWGLSSTADLYTPCGAGGLCRVDVKLGAA